MNQLLDEFVIRSGSSLVEPGRRQLANQITFHTPGLKAHQTSECSGSMSEFVSISVTGTSCALNCEHCQTKMLTNMVSLPAFNGSLYDLCAHLKNKGAKGVLISGGSDLGGKVPLIAHVPDLIRAREELGLLLRIHTGLTDEATCAALARVGIDGVMVDIIGDQETITDVYHIKDTTPADYEVMLKSFHAHSLPAIPHIILGHYFGQMRGEYDALEMITRYPPKVLVLVILMPLTGTPMAGIAPPSLKDIGVFFKEARAALPQIPIQLGCARPMGPIKYDIDRLAIDSGFNGIAYPAEGIVRYAASKGLEPKFIHACCGVTWN